MEQGRGILALPVEVMGMVVGHFCPHCAGAGLESMDSAHAELQGTLVALSRVNSRIGRAAQQTLFHVVLTGRNSLPKLLRTLMEQPAFASYIRVVDLGAFAGNHDSVWSYLDRQGAKKLWALACSAASGLPFSALPGVVEAYRTGSTWAVPPWGECDRLPGARLQVFVLLKLAVNVKAIVIRSEWPLATFAQFPEPGETKEGPGIKVTRTGSKTTLRVSLARSAPLANVEEVHLTGQAFKHTTGSCSVPLAEAADLLSRLPNLRRLGTQGSSGVFYAAVDGKTILSNLTELSMRSCSLPPGSLGHILSTCSATLKRFRFSCAPETGNHLVTHLAGADIVRLLVQAGDLAQSLQSLEIDTSHSEILADHLDWPDNRATFRTVPSLAHFCSLRRLSISADSIYFPSKYPGVLLRDGHSGPSRLVDFVPSGLRTLEITGITAIHLEDVRALAAACGKRRNTHLRDLGRVVFRAGGVLRRGPVPYDSEWEAFADLDLNAGYFYQPMDFESIKKPLGERVAGWFAAAGVEYEFDRHNAKFPWKETELFTDFYSGWWNS